MNTDKQPQTVYVKLPESNTGVALIGKSPSTKKPILTWADELPDRYIFTKEELQALLQKERREAAEKALNWVHDFEIECPRMHKQEYLNKHYPLPPTT